MLNDTPRPADPRDDFTTSIAAMRMLVVVLETCVSAGDFDAETLPTAREVIKELKDLGTEFAAFAHLVRFTREYGGMETSFADLFQLALTLDAARRRTLARAEELVAAMKKAPC